MQTKKTLLVILSVGLVICTGSRSFAWGQKYISSSSLVYPIYKAHKINYCVKLVDAENLGYTHQSIVTQMKLALNLWLIHVRSLIGQIRLQHVECSSPSLNLEIYVGPDNTSDVSSDEADIYDGKRSYAKIIIRTNTDPTKWYPVYDFGFVASKVGLSMDAATKFSAEKISLAEGETRLNSQKGELTSYPLLVHEMGHAFGLCDTDPAVASSMYCDPQNSKPSNLHGQPYSVMWEGAGYYLTPDDIAGIQNLFKRFAWLK